MIASKTSEINAMEERYVQYLEKAKMVLRQMDPRNSNSISSQEIQSLKKHLDEKDRRFKDLEVSRRRRRPSLSVHSISFVLQKEYEKMKAIRDDQEKLLISAWYSLVSVSSSTHTHSSRSPSPGQYLSTARIRRTPEISREPIVSRQAAQHPVGAQATPV